MKYKIYRYLFNLPYWKLLILCFLSFAVLNALFISLVQIFDITSVSKNPKLVEWIDSLNPIFVFLLAVIVFPFFETIYLQVISVELLLVIFNKFHKRNFIALILASLIFGFMHPYNLFYITAGFLTGLFLNYMYLLGRRRKESAIFLPLIVHVGWNLIAFILMILR